MVIDRTRCRFARIDPVRSSARVPVLAATMEPDVETWRAVVGAGIDGLVVEGMGVGHVPQLLAPILVDAAASFPVVLATRTGGGSVHERTYGFVGSEQYLIDNGLISAGWLDPLKARVLTALELRSESPDVASAFQPVQPHG